MDLDVHLPAIVAGDARAFGRWVAGAELRLRLSLASFAAHVDVEAVLQETLLRVWQVAPRLEPDGKPDMLIRFAVRVGRNTAISELRKLGKPVPGAEDEATVRPIAPDPMLREIIAACRDKLPVKPGQALSARLEAPTRSDHELAATLHMVKNTFLQNITRARKMLVDCLKRAGIELEEVWL